MRKIWYCLLSLIFIVQITGCTYHEPLSQEEAKELLNATIGKVEEILRDDDDLEKIPVSIHYINADTKCYEDANISKYGREYFYKTPNFELSYNNNFIFKETYKQHKSTQKTKKEFDYNSLTFPKLTTNTEMITLIYELLAGDCIKSYNAEIYDYDNYNLTVLIDQNKTNDLILPFKSQSISIQSFFTKQDGTYTNHSVKVQFDFSQQETIKYEYLKDISYSNYRDYDDAIYDPNMTFELPNHDHLLNK